MHYLSKEQRQNDEDQIKRTGREIFVRDLNVCHFLRRKMDMYEEQLGSNG